MSSNCYPTKMSFSWSAKKRNPLDPMSASMVVNCQDELLPVITFMINASLSSGYFPPEWKNPLVSPVRVKPGNDNSFENKSPVRNLQFVSKLTKRAVFNQIHSHMEQFSSYPLLKSAYRKFHCIETALLKVHIDFQSNMDQKRVDIAGSARFKRRI